VSHGVAAEFNCYTREGLGLHDALGADAQGVELPAAHVPHDEEAQHLLEIVGARVHLAVRQRAECARARGEGAGRSRIDPAGVDGHGDDGAMLVLGEPRHEEGGVEPAGVGEDDG
jgi:hypothetical protein